MAHIFKIRVPETRATLVPEHRFGFMAVSREPKQPNIVFWGFGLLTRGWDYSTKVAFVTLSYVEQGQHDQLVDVRRPWLLSGVVGTAVVQRLSERSHRVLGTPVVVVSSTYFLLGNQGMWKYKCVCSRAGRDISFGPASRRKSLTVERCIKPLTFVVHMKQTKCALYMMLTRDSGVQAYPFEGHQRQHFKGR